MPAHHVPSDALLAYAAGNSTAGEELLVACHLSACPQCRSTVDDAERIGEVLLDRVDDTALSASRTEDLLASLLDRLDVPEPPPPPVPRCSVFPAPLVRRIGPLASVPWRTLGFGVRGGQVDLDGDQRVFLLDFPPGFRIPTHDHQGTERALVLRGAFVDDRSRFAPGDVSWSEHPGHDVRIEPGERCTTLFVNDGAAEIGPLLTPLVDWWIQRR